MIENNIAIRLFPFKFHNDRVTHCEQRLMDWRLRKAIHSRTVCEPVSSYLRAANLSPHARECKANQLANERPVLET